MSESNKFQSSNINFMKNINKEFLLTQFTNIHQLNRSISFGRPKNSQRKTLYFLKDYNNPKNLAIIFHDDNEKFLSENIWLIFGKHRNFKSLYIPYNCQFIVIDSETDQSFSILEIYNTRIYTRNSYVSYFGKWDEKNDLQIFERDFYQRRFDMNETMLVVVGDYLPGPCPHIGVCVYEEIVTEIGRIMNFRPALMSMQRLRQLWKDDVWVLYEIYIGLFVLDSYAYWRDSMAPFWETQAFLHIQYIKLYEQGERSPHLRPFATDVWIAISIWIIISGICVTFIDHKINRRNYSIIDSIFRSFESFTNQCGCRIPNAVSSRIAAIMARIGAVLLNPLYSAVVISFVTVKIIQLPFADLSELIKDGSFKFGYENTTLIGKILKESKNPDTKIINEKFLVDLDQMPVDMTDAIDKMCKDPKFAFAYFNGDLHYEKQKCKIIQIPKSVYKTWDALLLRQNSNYYTIFNRLLKSFRSSGILNKLGKEVYAKKLIKNDEPVADPVEFKNVSELLMLIFSLYLFVPVILIIELLIFRKSKKIKNPSKLIYYIPDTRLAYCRP